MFVNALLTVCTTIRAYVIVTFFISQSLFRCIVLLLVFLMDWEEMVYFCALLFFSYVKKITSVNLLPSELPAVEHLQNETLDEGSNLTKECNVTAGSPSPTVFWETGYTFEGNRLIITNITRSQRGEYRCIANNTCGRVSATMFIDVLCKNIYNTSLFVVCIL